MKATHHKIEPGKPIVLSAFDPAHTGKYTDKKAAAKQLKKDIAKMAALQYKLYAENRRAILIIFQAMDSAGKDSAIQHILTGINPQGCEVHSFKHPSAEELDHDYLWRHYVHLPDRGRIGIFNRSHYENVLITKVHPELLMAENLPEIHTPADIPADFWEKRYRQINAFEKTIAENGTVILKFFLHLSKGEQKKRFLDRINQADKHWKFAYSDIRERGFWDDYQQAYEDAINQTSTAHAPWYIIPADHKWYTRVAIGNIIVATMQAMNIRMPAMTPEETQLLEKGREALLAESA
ncbi:MAG: polyphosphate kinase 2 family protein [Lewinellaceae bacterium]|nr:polyphosphate kinase 2 family protein [Lewinellaceae bacterium]